MTVEVLQPGIIVQTLLKVLLSTSICWSLKKNAHLLLCAFKEDIYEPNQHFYVLWVGLQVSLFSLPDEPRGVYTLPPAPPAWLRFTRCCLPGWAVGSARWDICGGCGDGGNKNKNKCLSVCAWCWQAEESQSLPKLSCGRYCLQRSVEKIPIRKSASVWKRFSVCLNHEVA